MNAKPSRFLLALAALALAGCASTDAGPLYFGKLVPPTENVLRVGNGAEPRSFDPHKSSGIPESHIFDNVHEGLTGYDPRTLAPRPALAVGWSADANAGVWTFTLRRNGRFSDDTPITARDFVWSWRRIVTPETASPYASFLYYVKNGQAIAEGKLPPEKLGVSAVDDYTLRVEMEKPTAFFIKMTPHYAFTVLPRHTIEKHGDLWTRPENFVGNGPFVIAEAVPYSQVVLKKNPLYWDSGRVRLDKVVLIPAQEESQNANLYRAGEIDVVFSNYLPAPFIRKLRTYRDFQGGAQFTNYYYSLNVKRGPLKDVRVRRALNLALDKQAIAERFIGRGEKPATTFVPPGVPGYLPPPGPGYDPETARRLLAEAGYPGGKEFPVLTLYYNTQENHRTVAQAVQRMWKEQLGIRINLQNEEWQTFQARRERRDFDVARDSWVGDYIDPSTYLDLLSRDTLQNHPGWVDPKYTRLMSQANAEPDEQKRNRLLRAAEAYLIDQMPVIPVYFYALAYMKKPWVAGWYPNLLDQHPFKYVSIDRDWPQHRLARQP
ncbi:MAG: peptide ABC transporter substrate-binding protein [Aphanocapsa lilacina HA4352-LM1]|nr:peptide ABC transporter substrate-binding protein [Aphanocapsa lilacina HA4352-LM1]